MVQNPKILQIVVTHIQDLQNLVIYIDDFIKTQFSKPITLKERTSMGIVCNGQKCMMTNPKKGTCPNSSYVYRDPYHWASQDYKRGPAYWI